MVSALTVNREIEPDVDSKRQTETINSLLSCFALNAIGVNRTHDHLMQIFTFERTNNPQKMS